jgi:hypothetical protein
MTGAIHVLHVYEPRWHGRARWEWERWDDPENNIFAVETEYYGWVKRSLGSEYVKKEFPVLSLSRDTVKELAKGMA